MGLRASFRLFLVTALAVMLPLLPAFAQATSDSAPDKVTARYYTEMGDDAKQLIHWQILELALQKSGHPYDLGIGGNVPAPERFMYALENDQLPGAVAWIGTSPDFEERLLPVRVPMFLGLLSYHGLLINDKNADHFANVRSLDDLKRFSVLMGRTWGEIPAFKEAGFKVVTGPYQRLTEMIAANRGDFLPQALILERSLLKFAEEGGVSLEKNIVLYYPSEMYFFVSRKNQKLHDALYDGMMAALADGSYLALLQSHPDTKDIFDGHQSGRRLIKMDNRFMTEETRQTLRQYSIGEQLFPDAGK